MITLFSRAELLDEWLTRRGYQPLRADSSVDISTGTDIRSLLGRELDDWIRYVYATASPALLPTVDGAPAARLTFTDAPEMAARLVVPEGAGRLLAVRLSCWERPVAPVPCGSAPDLAASNPFMQPDGSVPLAVTDPDGTIVVRPARAGATVERLLYIPSPPEGDEPVALDPLLLATMGAYDPQLHHPNQS